MNKAELVAAIAEKCGSTKKYAEDVLAAIIASVEDALKHGEKIQLMGFGSFEVKDRAKRTSRNPLTKELIVVPATKVPAFKAGKDFKEKVNR